MLSVEKNILRFAKISLIWLFLVVCAGSIVRMTGSGMGCPDWPFCFGHIIPPLTEEPLKFKPGVAYSQGQMIISSDTLWVANHDFVSTDTFDRTQWHKYPKHDYAVFNATHTWIEYINRLATVVLGLPCVMLFALSLLWLAKTGKKQTALLSLLVLAGIGFEAWLGKLVVDGNLKENSITWHMLGTLFIILMLVSIIRVHSPRAETKCTTGLKYAAFALLALSFVQIVLGTQVREEIDVLAKNIDDRSQWIEQLTSMFEIHRTFAYSLILAVGLVFFLLKKSSIPLRWAMGIAGLLLAEIAAGVVLSYASMPGWMQPVHLLLGVLLFATSANLVMRITMVGKASSDGTPH